MLIDRPASFVSCGGSPVLGRCHGSPNPSVVMGENLPSDRAVAGCSQCPSSEPRSPRRKLKGPRLLAAACLSSCAGAPGSPRHCSPGRNKAAPDFLGPAFPGWEPNGHAFQVTLTFVGSCPLASLFAPGGEPPGVSPGRRV